MNIVFLLLYIAAILCFLLSAFGKPVGKANTLALGLAFWVAVPLIQALQTF